jgi:tRNA-Thr(GGU) m(6)t(6)A37 methyltransferase TsaA
MNRFVAGFCLSLLVVAVVLGQGRASAAESSEKTFIVKPIGQVQKTDGRTLIVLDKKYQDGLLGLSDWSHIYVIWWFDKNDTPEKRAILQAHARAEEKYPITGVFAWRAAVRPNLIALTICRIVSIKENVIEIKGIDADNGTPVIDLKPYSPITIEPSTVRMPDWAR